MNKLLHLHSTRPAVVDRLRQEFATTTVQAAGIVGFALLTALAAQVRIYIWEIPITMQTLVVYGSGLYLGWRGGLLAQVLYLVLGLFLPVYAGEGFGAAYLMSSASAGYLLAFPLVAAVVGLLSRRWNSLVGSSVTLIAGSVCLFTIGVLWLHFAADHGTWFESIERGWLRFIPIDLAKIILVSLLYDSSRRLRA